MQTSSTSPDKSAQIASLAYRYFEESGRVHGHDLEHWLRAEKELRAATVH